MLGLIGNLIAMLAVSHFESYSSFHRFQLENLQGLTLTNFSQLASVDHLSRLTNLQFLVVCWCPRVERLCGLTGLECLRNLSLQAVIDFLMGEFALFEPTCVQLWSLAKAGDFPQVGDVRASGDQRFVIGNLAEIIAGEAPPEPPAETGVLSLEKPAELEWLNAPKPAINLLLNRQGMRLGFERVRRRWRYVKAWLSRELKRDHTKTEEN